MTANDRQFLGTYFDRDAVLRWSRIIAVLGWIVAGIYGADLILEILVFALQVARGFMTSFGPSDFARNIVFILERPLHGVLYFALLQALSQGLLIMLDVEDNTRREARD